MADVDDVARPPPAPATASRSGLRRDGRELTVQVELAERPASVPVG